MADGVVIVPPGAEQIGRGGLVHSVDTGGLDTLNEYLMAQFATPGTIETVATEIRTMVKVLSAPFNADRLLLGG